MIVVDWPINALSDTGPEHCLLRHLVTKPHHIQTAKTRGSSSMHSGVETWSRRPAEAQTEYQNGEKRWFKHATAWQTNLSEYLIY